jgi:hypothetical protein
MNLGRGEFGVSILRGSYTERRGGARNVSSSILIHQLTWWENKGRGGCPVGVLSNHFCKVFVV